MKLLFIFMDGVGLGKDDPQVNPFVRATLPNLDDLLDGKKIIANGYHSSSGDRQVIINNAHASLLALDACLGVEGLPQSASGQASLLTGKNVSAMIGSHDGPKPNDQIMQILKEGTLFSQLRQREQGATLLNAYPPRYFHSIERGYRLPGVIALSAIYAGMQLRTMDDLNRGEAISADFTAVGWREHLDLPNTPILDPNEAGERLRELSDGCELALFEYWLTDMAGHQQDMQSACDLLELIDKVLGSLVSSWDDEAGLIMITSDHGNLEDLSTRRHTRNDVPLLLIGSPTLRQKFIQELDLVRGVRAICNLTDIAPVILKQTEAIK